jgi:hypothetical protein
LENPVAAISFLLIVGASVFAVINLYSGRVKR